METRPRPLVLIRGFGGLDIEDDRRNAYQGFNDGTVYPSKRGQNYIYEGFVLKAFKARDKLQYTDATDVIGYYPVKMPAMTAPRDAAAGGPRAEDDDDIVDEPAVLSDDGWNEAFATGSIIIDQQMVQADRNWTTRGSIWVYRYYDLNPRSIDTFAAGLVKLIDGIAFLHGRDREAYLRSSEAERATLDAAGKSVGEFDGVDVVAHSMGGLVMARAMKLLHKREVSRQGSEQPAVVQGAAKFIHRAVTLGTPHRGIAFQRMPEALLSFVHIGADTELGAFDPTKDRFNELKDFFPPERILTVVGTNYRDYNIKISSAGNRLASLLAGEGLTYNRSDGLVKQAAAQLPGAPRTFVNKCHGGTDSLVTSREAYEIAMRFFHGTHKVRLWLDPTSKILGGGDFLGRSEFFFGVSIKPRGVDFSLFEQTAASENCYGPFRKPDFTEGPKPLGAMLELPLSEGDGASGWAEETGLEKSGHPNLIWEGWIDNTAGAKDDDDPETRELVFRLDVYVSERDTMGIGFSDNVIFSGQYWLQVLQHDGVTIIVHTSEQSLASTRDWTPASPIKVDTDSVKLATAEVVAGKPTEWTFDVGGPNFSGKLRIGLTPSDQSR